MAAEAEHIFINAADATPYNSTPMRVRKKDSDPFRGEQKLRYVVFYVKRSAGTSTLLFKGSVNGVDYVAWPCVKMNGSPDTLATSSETADDVWVAEVSGLTFFDVQLNALAGGVISVWANGVI